MIECINSRRNNSILLDRSRKRTINNKSVRGQALFEFTEFKIERAKVIKASHVRSTADSYRDLSYEYSFAEIAIVMDLSVSQVKVLYLNAMRHIRVAFDHKGIYLPDEGTIEDIWHLE